MIKTRYTLAALSTAMILSGCAGGQSSEDRYRAYVQRIDTVTPTVGDAMAVNEATQVITPWPSYVSNTRFTVDGARGVNAVNCYEHSKYATACPPKSQPTLSQ